MMMKILDLDRAHCIAALTKFDGDVRAASKFALLSPVCVCVCVWAHVRVSE